MLSNSQMSWLGRMADRYHEALTPKTRSYLEARGIGPGVASGYRLGELVDPDPMHEPYRGRLSIPFITPSGVVSIRFRCLQDHDCREWEHGKYEGLPGEATHLYNVQALHDADTVVGISEGELDALVATEAGLPSVGVPGANNWKPYYHRLFDDFERVICVGDGDSAGRFFTRKLTQELPNAEAKLMPAGFDVNSYIIDNGPEAFLSYVFA